MMRKIKARLFKRGSRGFTLVEIIVASALLGVLLLGMLMFVSPVLESVNTQERDARALSVGSSMETYISRSIRNSVYVAVFENAEFDDCKLNGAVYNNAKLTEMEEFVKKTDNIAVYELKCISLRWMYDDKLQEYKYMLCNETVQNGGRVLLDGKTERVFDSCFYEQLFPRVNISMLNNQIEGDPALDPADVKDVAAIKVDVNIFTDNEMDTDLIFVGTGYTEFINIKNKLYNKDGKFKIYPKSDTTVRTAAEAQALGIPGETYIYYVTRRSNYNASSPTPAPSP